MDAREHEILDAAELLFAEGGLDALTVRALVSRSGASVGSVYHRYTDRGGVLAALALRALAEGMGRLQEALSGEPDAREGVLALVHAWLGWVEARRVRAAIVYATFGTPELAPHAAMILAEKAELYGPVFGWMQARMDLAELRPLPQWALDPVVFGPAHEFARRWLAGPPAPMAEARALITESMCRAVAPDAPDAPRQSL